MPAKAIEQNLTFMTALREYERLEAMGLWRPSAEEQRREVVVSIGDATLTICDLNDRALTHWSLAAIDRLNPGEFPACFGPYGDPGESLELGEDESQMITAIEKLRRAIEKARPHPGRLRLASVAVIIATILVLLFFWLPGALLKHTVSVVPDIKRTEIGQALLNRIERVAGSICESRGTGPVLARLARRTGAARLVVLPAGLADSRHLPGGIVILNKAQIEDFEDPAVAAGFVIAETLRANRSDPLADLLASAGPVASFRLLTTGELTTASLDAYAENVLVAPRDPLPVDPLLDAFETANVPSTPYAYALDPTGETVLALIEADPMAGQQIDPVLPDRDWVLLQSICGG